MYTVPCRTPGDYSRRLVPPRVAGSPVEAEVAKQAGAERGRGGAIPGGGDGAEQAKRGFVSGVKAALGKVGGAFKGSRGKTADKELPKVEL